GERLELVTDFARLKTGDRVLILTCDHCGSSHAGSLERFVSDSLGKRPGNEGAERSDAWITDSVCDGLPVGVTPELIPVHRLFLIEDGAESAATKAVAR